MSTETVGMNAAPGAPGQELWQSTGTISIAAGATATLTFTGDASNAGTLIVPTGKTLYITDIYVGANTAVQFSVTVQFTGTPTVLFNGFCKGDTGPIVMDGIETQPQVAGDGVHTLQIVFGTASATTAAYFLSGYTQ